MPNTRTQKVAVVILTALISLITIALLGLKTLDSSLLDRNYMVQTATAYNTKTGLETTIKRKVAEKVQFSFANDFIDAVVTTKTLTPVVKGLVNDAYSDHQASIDYSALDTRLKTLLKGTKLAPLADRLIDIAAPSIHTAIDKAVKRPAAQLRAKLKQLRRLRSQIVAVTIALVIVTATICGYLLRCRRKLIAVAAGGGLMIAEGVWWLVQQLAVPAALNRFTPQIRATIGPTIRHALTTAFSDTSFIGIVLFVIGLIVLVFTWCLSVASRIASA